MAGKVGVEEVDDVGGAGCRAAFEAVAEPLHERIEVAAGVTGLHQSVRDQQQYVAPGEPVAARHRPLRRGQVAQPERQRRRAFQRADLAAGDQYRLHVPVVGHRHPVRQAVVLDEHGGREQFGVPDLLGLADQSPFQPGGDGRQVPRLVGGLAEAAQDRRDRADRREPFAAYVADDGALPGPGGADVEEVAAHHGPGLARPVQAGREYVPDLVRHRAQQGPHQGLGDGVGVDEVAFLAAAVRGEGGGEDADDGGGDVGGDVVGLAQVVGDRGEEAFQEDREDGERGHDGRAVGVCGDGGQGDEEEAHRPFLLLGGFQEEDEGHVDERQPPRPRRRCGRPEAVVGAGREEVSGRVRLTAGPRAAPCGGPRTHGTCAHGPPDLSVIDCHSVRRKSGRSCDYAERGMLPGGLRRCGRGCSAPPACRRRGGRAPRGGGGGLRP